MKLYNFKNLLDVAPEEMVRIDEVDSYASVPGGITHQRKVRRGGSYGWQWQFCGEWCDLHPNNYDRLYVDTTIATSQNSHNNGPPIVPGKSVITLDPDDGRDWDAEWGKVLVELEDALDKYNKVKHPCCCGSSNPPGHGHSTWCPRRIEEFK